MAIIFSYLNPLEHMSAFYWLGTLHCLPTPGLEMSFSGSPILKVMCIETSTSLGSLHKLKGALGS